MPSRSRRRFDDDDAVSPRRSTKLAGHRTTAIDDDDDEPDGPSLSTYHHPDALRGPEPAPAWVPISGEAVDNDHGVLKSGKEADVSLLHRATPDGAGTWLAVKRYRDAQHRMFHRDAGYLEGRRTRYSRENRAMDTRTAFGKQLIAGQWAVAEFAILGRLWAAGAAVPYPVQLLGTELMMEFVGSADGVAAPRLAQLRPDEHVAAGLYAQLVDVLRCLADEGYAHGDLSAYNVLVQDGRLVLIDVPQAVDLVGNPQGFEFLRRDCVNICGWFAGRGVHADPRDLEHELAEIATPRRRRP
ncbi:MAG: RIO1 family regulatory kinase/ATPase [Ilumatobacteraceae bacterium]